MHLKTLGIQEHTMDKQWKVAFHEEFLPEFREFSDAVRQQVYSLIEMLAVFGPNLGRPQVDTLKGSKHSNMKELRFRADDGAWRIAFAFDVKRQAILLVGGDKSGVSQSKFYRNLIEISERRFDQHLRAVAAKKGA
jgi:hypothetical protein